MRLILQRLAARAAKFGTNTSDEAKKIARAERLALLYCEYAPVSLKQHVQVWNIT